MPGIDSNPLVQVSRSLPAANPDAKQPIANPRAGRYGEQYSLSIVPTTHLLSDEGTYFTSNSAQTGQATAAAPTAFSATNPFLLIYNGDSAGGKRIYLDYAKLIATAAGTGGTALLAAITIDSGNRYSSGGTSLSAVNANMDNSSAKSVASVYAGNITATAASAAARTVIGQNTLKGAIPVANDMYMFKFGTVDGSASLQVATVTFSVVPAPPVVIGPGQSALIHLWLPAQSAASSYAPELSWWER